MSMTPPILGPGGWTVDPIPPAGGGATIEIVTEAELPTPSASNANAMYFVSDRRGGTLVISDGASMVEVSPGVSDVSGIPASTWALRGSGTLYDLRYVSHASWNQIVRALHDGTRYQADSGRQLLYSLRAPIVGNTGATSTATLPNVTIPADLMGLNGAIDIELGGEAGATPTGMTPSITFDGFDLAGGAAGTNRRLWIGRRMRNQNSASAQKVYANAGATGAFAFADNDPRTATKNTATDLVLGGSVVWTHASSITGQVNDFKVWWVAG